MFRKKTNFLDFILSENTIAQRVEEKINNVKQLREKVRYLSIILIFLMLLSKNKDPLAIFILEVIDNFDITKKLLILIPMADTITYSELLYNCVEICLNELEVN